MPAGQGQPPFDSLAARWHDLAERRLAHFTELYHSGRWRLYYRTEQQFAVRMLDVIRAAKTWARLAGREPPAIAVPVATTSALPVDALPVRAVLATAPKPKGLRPAA